MSKHKSDDKKKKKKSSQLVIRIDAGERDAFVKLCDALDTSAAREIRRFMREWVATHQAGPADAEAATAVAGSTDAAPDSGAAPEAPSAAKPVAKGRRKPVVAATA